MLIRKCETDVSVVVRRMYYWDLSHIQQSILAEPVSVVVRRMYYWDRERRLWLMAESGFSSC